MRNAVYFGMIMVISLWFVGFGCMSYSYRSDVDAAAAKAAVRGARGKYCIAAFSCSRQTEMYLLLAIKNATGGWHVAADELDRELITKRLNDLCHTRYPELFAANGDAAVPLSVELTLNGDQNTGKTLAYSIPAFMTMTIFPVMAVQEFNGQVRVKPLNAAVSSNTSRSFVSKDWMEASVFSPLGLIYFPETPTRPITRGIMLDNDVLMSIQTEPLIDVIALEVAGHDREYAQLSSQPAGDRMEKSGKSDSVNPTASGKAPGGGVVAPVEPASSAPGSLPF